MTNEDGYTRSLATRMRVQQLKADLQAVHVSRNVTTAQGHTIYKRTTHRYEVRAPKQDRDRYGMKPYVCRLLVEALAFVAYNSAYPTTVDHAAWRTDSREQTRAAVERTGRQLGERRDV